METSSTSRPFFARHEFLIRRWHSLTGLVPVGAFMTVHLTVNASILESPASFQRAVYQIHSLGRLLPIVEWAFIFAPILFHGLIGLLIYRSGMTNAGRYRYANNIRYTLQRITAVVAFVFILWHVFHMHGWFHFDFWLKNFAGPFGGAQFRPFSAGSTLGEAFAGTAIPIMYAIGVLACVFHLANGIWTMGLTWGLWTSRAAQRRANWVSGIAGLLLAGIGFGALFGAVTVNIPKALETEDGMYRARAAAKEIPPSQHKRADHDGLAY